MTVTKSHNLKQLEIRRTKKLLDLEDVKKELKSLTDKRDDLQKEVERIDELIRKNTSNGIVVSEHAFIRYFERVLGYNLKEIREKIISQEMRDQLEVLESGKFAIGEGRHAIVKKRVIITITEGK